MGRRPEGTSIDRIDNDKGYFPENCRWATKKEQQRNKRNTVLVNALGITKTIPEWAEHQGANKASTIRARLARGWEPEKAIFHPLSMLGKEF